MNQILQQLRSSTHPGKFAIKKKALKLKKDSRCVNPRCGGDLKLLWGIKNKVNHSENRRAEPAGSIKQILGLFLKSHFVKTESSDVNTFITYIFKKQKKKGGGGINLDFIGSF